MATYWGTLDHDDITPGSLSPGVAISGTTLPPQDNVYDYLYGGDGYDRLDGGLGADYMDGGDGNDWYRVDSTGDQIYEARGDLIGGYDTVSSTVSFTLPSTLEHLWLLGVANINATGNAKDNWLYDNPGNNVLNGKAGADVMYGELGNDTYYVDNVDDFVQDDTMESSGDKVISTISYTLPWEIENLTLQGSAAINATGNGEANLLVGNGARNVLTGGYGPDKLNGGAGDDVYDFNLVDESTGAMRDRILSFQFGTSTTGDRIDLVDIDADVALAGNQAFKWGRTATKSKGYLWAENSANGDTIIKGNTDADTEAEFQVAVADGTRLPSAWIGADFLL